MRHWTPSVVAVSFCASCNITEPLNPEQESGVYGAHDTSVGGIGISIGIALCFMVYHRTNELFSHRISWLSV